MVAFGLIFFLPCRFIFLSLGIGKPGERVKLVVFIYLDFLPSFPFSLSLPFLFIMSAVAMVERWKIFLLFIVKCLLWGRNQEKEKKITWLHMLTVAR